MKKIKYKAILGVLLLSFPVLMLFSCSDKEDVIIESEKLDLVLEEDQIDIKIGNQVEINIVEGNNAYKVFSLNEDIVGATISGNKIVMNALEIGKTAIIVSDGAGIYRTLNIKSYKYETPIIEINNVNFKIPIGNSKSTTIKILEGNGGYKAESSNPEIASVNVVGDTLLNITGYKEGKAIITIFDGIDFVSSNVEVEITETTDPYNELELEEIMEKEDLCYVFSNQSVLNSTTYYTLLNRIEGGRNLYGWDYYNFYYLKIYFEGDKEVGIKENSSLLFRYSSTNLSADSINFEIIKNDGEKIWAVFSFIQNEKLEYGYFIQKINP